MACDEYEATVCDWPNRLASAKGAIVQLPSIEDRRRAWADLGGFVSHEDLEAHETKISNRSQAQRQRWAKAMPKNPHRRSCRSCSTPEQPRSIFEMHPEDGIE